MDIVQSPDFRECIKKLTKPKFSGTYGTLISEINDFFNDFPTFDLVWKKSYMLFENGPVRVNKVRLENRLQNSGKSGGYRMIIICDNRTETVGLLYIYPKTGAHGKNSLSLEFSKKLVKDYAKAKQSKNLTEFKLLKKTYQKPAAIAIKQADNN